MRPIHVFLLLLLLSCSYNPPEQPEGIPDIIVFDDAHYRWYRDSTLNDFIRPAEWGELIPDEVVIHTDVNYYETEFSDTFWGV